MSFRWRLLLGISLAVFLTAVVYGALGYLSFKRAQDRQIEENFAGFRTAIVSSLNLSGERPAFKADADLQIFSKYQGSVFQVMREGQALLDFGTPSEENTAWKTEKLELVNNYMLEVSLSIGENRSALSAYLRTTLLVLPIAFAIALFMGLLLNHFLLVPVKQLQHATTQLSRQAIPEPVDVPAGGDELSQLAESFNRMTDSLQAFIERERSFTRYASHELRTPLSNFKVLVEGMKSGLLPAEATYGQLEQTLERMEGILSGLLTLTRSPNLNPEPIMLKPIVQSVCETLAYEQQERIDLVLRGSPIILGRDDLIRQVVMNLAQNALKYSKGHVEVRLEENATSATIIVRDWGEGVPEDKLENLTEPFFRLNTRKHGLGLGLALVQHIIHSVGGNFDVTNVQPGLRARISLPLVDVPEDTFVKPVNVNEISETKAAQVQLDTSKRTYHA